MPRPFDGLARSVVACALAVFSLMPPWPSTSAQRPRGPSVALRVVSATPDPALALPLRTAMEEALASIDVQAPATGERAGFLLDATVTRMSSAELAVGHRVDCEVSIIIEDARRHSVLGVLTGRSHVIGDAGRTLEQAAIRAAARGALRSLSTAIAAR